MKGDLEHFTTRRGALSQLIVGLLLILQVATAEFEAMKHHWETAQSDFALDKYGTHRHGKGDVIDRWETSWLNRWLSLNNTFRGKTVGDYGIGGGLLGELLCTKYQVKRYVGIDIATRQINAAAARLDKLPECNRTLVLQASNLDFTSLGLDILISQQVIQHFPSQSYLDEWLAAINRARIPSVFLEVRSNSNKTIHISNWTGNGEGGKEKRRHGVSNYGITIGTVLNCQYPLKLLPRYELVDEWVTTKSAAYSLHFRACAFRIKSGFDAAGVATAAADAFSPAVESAAAHRPLSDSACHREARPVKVNRGPCTVEADLAASCSYTADAADFARNCQFRYRVPMFADNNWELPRRTRYPTCAVVSSAGSLYGSGCGKTIDAAGVVFRVNNAPIEGYEKDVGLRTTFMVLNSHNARKISATSSQYDEGYVQKFCASKTTAVLGNDEWHGSEIGRDKKTSAAFQNNTACAVPENVGRKVIDVATTFSSPFRRLANGDLGRFFLAMIRDADKESKGESLPRKMPSSGFFAVMLSFTLCDHVTLYGFSSSVNMSRAHYYSDAGGKQDDPFLSHLIKPGGLHDIEKEHRAVDAWGFHGGAGLCEVG